MVLLERLLKTYKLGVLEKCRREVFILRLRLVIFKVSNLLLLLLLFVLNITFFEALRSKSRGV